MARRATTENRSVAAAIVDRRSPITTWKRAAVAGLSGIADRPNADRGSRIALRASTDRRYAKHLGFNALVKQYEPNPDPLKNFPPWITRTPAGVDINFIINANVAP